MNEILEMCINAAKKSPCNKRRFGAILVNNNEIINIDCNRYIEGLEYLCKNECVRNNIKSGTESMIGSCGHAEERVIWNSINNGININDSEIYVAGIEINGNLYKKLNPYFYCIRCATTMYYAKIKGVWVWVDIDSKWHFLTVKEALKSSMDFALKTRED